MGLKKGQRLRSDLSGRCYRVVSSKVAEGGFGKIYRGVELSASPHRRVCLRVLSNPTSWHGEAYLGNLLAGRRGAVELLDSFVLARPSRAATKYLLVSDWMAEGTVQRASAEGRMASWPERRVRKGLTDLLGVLSVMHARGLCHGGITPANVFISAKRLLLGDFGLARASLEPGPVHLNGEAPKAFVPPDLSIDSGGSHDHSGSWTPSADVYQVALVALSLLEGSVVEVVDLQDGTGNVLRDLAVSDELKGWLWDALARGSQRFRDAGEALAVLRDPSTAAPRRPASLKRQRVVLTGHLDGMTRAEVHSLIRRAGGVPQGDVCASTTVLVAGRASPNGLAGRQGTKLLAAHRRIRSGQEIAIISDVELARLLPARG